jgi:hypothetical protein
MRWLAIGTAPGWEDLDKFGAELKATSQWRPDPRTTISTVTALEDGRLLAECQGVSKEAFEKWLEGKGWQIESITPVSHLARFGSIWKAR